jgi:DNA-nicking Smr family endonuclease
MIIDLHGYHIHEAWHCFNRKINEAYFAGYKKCHVITGQGAMMHEFEIWARNHPKIRDCTQHPYNPGSFTIKFAKKG